MKKNRTAPTQSQKSHALNAIRDALRPEFYNSIAEVLRSARAAAYRAVNSGMVQAFWNIGRMLVEEEQRGSKRAEYGAFLVANLSTKLTSEFGAGFDISNIKRMRQLYIAYPGLLQGVTGSVPIRATLRHELSPSISADSGAVQGSMSIGATLWHQLTWSHFKLLLKVEKPEARDYYAREAVAQNWSVRALERQINSLYYERLALSRSKSPVVAEMKAKTAPLTAAAQDFVKDPYVLEFLGIPDGSYFRESDLEQGIITKLQAFMLELGKGFAFVARQQRISTETKDFYVDLVFYNYLLKCFVLIDLKAGELTHQDIGQMDMYVRLYEDKYKSPDDNPTIGIILCTAKDEW